MPGIQCDVNKEEDVLAMLRRAATFGDRRIDLLFNNAGAELSQDFEQQPA